MTKKLLIVSPEYPPESGFGGIGTYVRDFSHILTKYSDLEVHVLSISYKKSQNYNDNRVKIHRIKISNNIFSLYFGITMWLLKNYRRFDYIEDELYGGYCAATRFLLGNRFRYITKIHGTSREVLVLERYKSLFKRFKMSIANSLEGYSARRSPLIVSSCSLTAVYSSFLFGLNFSKHYVQPLPYLSADKGKIDKKLIYLPEKYFLFVGRIQKKKGSEVLNLLITKLIEKHKDYSFVLLGKDVDNFRNKFSNNKKIVFIDHVQDQALYRYVIRNSKIAIFPSQFESFLYTALNTIQEGVPLVISSNCGITEYFDETAKKYIVHNINSADDYIKVADMIIDNYQKSKIDIQNLNQHLQTAFDPQKLVKNYLNLINNCYEKPLQ